MIPGDLNRLSLQIGTGMSDRLRMKKLKSFPSLAGDSYVRKRVRSPKTKRRGLSNLKIYVGRIKGTDRGKRRGGDSTPRHRVCQCNCLAGSPVRPLQHLSGVDGNCTPRRATSTL